MQALTRLKLLRSMSFHCSFDGFEEWRELRIYSWSSRAHQRRLNLYFTIMGSEFPEQQPDLTDSAFNIPTDSENYSASNERSLSPPSSSSSPLVLYSRPTIWSLLRGAAINLLLPFVNGLMLGFGELLAHEAAFRLGWSGTKVCRPYLFLGPMDMNLTTSSTFIPRALFNNP